MHCFLEEMYKQVRVKNNDPFMLEPKYNLSMMDKYIEPSYYDIIYFQSTDPNKDNNSPVLEELFNFD